MSLVEEPLALESLSESLYSLVDEAQATGLSLLRFMSAVRSVVTALVLGGRLEGARLLKIAESYSASERPAARALVVFDGFAFYLYAKPYIDVGDVDVAIDEAGDVAKELGIEVVPIIAGYEFSVYCRKVREEY
ncbi:hypothetical protein [Hyperthermus butylicus]|uniref:Uncharacterized protein n=1 Tax=Hyperthermus butylicus (strain DSM 5456 / JCM 9403 / PLM1-5) TaxID=415426 RepID=A2BL22_HYPBU|nr:hypothetical protein [Hyperthermus butylicus]ABM80683.1 hypothetical protein Hbut_0831 [Hyperthermus butylicus DSM 5456]